MNFIYNKEYARVGILSNDAENGIHYIDDALETGVDTGLYTLEFYTPKTTGRTTHLSYGNYIETYTKDGKQLLLTITDINEDGSRVKVICEDTNVQALNGYVPGIVTPVSPQNIEYYLNQVLADTNFTIKTVESDSAEILQLNNDQRIHHRLQDIAKGFGLELDFDVEFSPGSPPKRFVSFVKRRYEGEEGFRISTEDLLHGIERQGNIYNLATKLIIQGAQKESTQVITEQEIERIKKEKEKKEEPTVSNAAQRAIAEAKRIAKLGLPYIWGGNGPNGYDCSGYMQKVWEVALGRQITSAGWPRATTYSMWAQDGLFRRISRDQLKPGDLIMYDTGYTTDIPNHVGLYLGPSLSAPNSVIHAGNPVGITQAANSMSIIGYVRVEH